MKTVTVHLESRSERTYDILIETGLIRKIGRDLKKRAIGNRYLVVTDKNVTGLIGVEFVESLRSEGLNGELFSIAAGEESKCAETVLEIAAGMTRSGLDRGSAVIALGGGVVGDIAGFASAIYMRGIPYVQVPTTLLAQIDSSVGGEDGNRHRTRQEPAGGLSPAQKGLHRPCSPSLSARGRDSEWFGGDDQVCGHQGCESVRHLAAPS